MENSVNTSFSRREKQIADLLARGMSEKEIATKLNISVATVNNHTRNMNTRYIINHDDFYAEYSSYTS